MKITFVTLLIDRDATTKIPVQVPEYELPVLEELYAVENLHVVQRGQVNIDKFDVDEVFAVLSNKYARTSAGAEAFKAAYRNKREFERAVEVHAEDPDEGEGQADLAALASANAPEVIAALGSLTDEELAELAEIEKAGKNRKGVLDAISATLGEGGGE